MLHPLLHRSLDRHLPQTDLCLNPANPTAPDDETSSHYIPGWNRAAWAVRGVKDRGELVWQREATVDVTYTDGGVEDRIAPEQQPARGASSGGGLFICRQKDKTSPP